VGESALVVRLMLTAGLLVAAGAGLLAAALYAAGGRGPLFPPAGPVRSAPNGLVVTGTFVVFVLATQLVYMGLEVTGFFRLVYGAGFPTGWPEKAAATIRFLWAATFAVPVQVVLISGLVQKTGGSVPWAGRGWRANVVTAYLTWLLVTPAAFAVFALANLAHTRLTGQPPDKHPLTALGEAAGPREWVLFVLQTIILAPALEELVFRGLLLPWLAQKRPADPGAPLTVPPARRPLAILVLSAAVAVLLHVDDVRAAVLNGDRVAALAHLLPGVFFLALLPIDLLLPRLNRLRRRLRIRSAQHARAVWAGSALFAAFHAQVWPSPVPLFVLALGLGYLYLRTRTLIGPVVVHGLFNAVSAVYLLLGGPA
jgi:membrane protease YdiL (CAAX protease family)